jgi:protein RecA
MSHEEKKEKEKKSVVISAANIIRERFGRSIEVSGDKYKKPIEAISSGSILLDNSIGKCKGYPRGSTIEVFGWEGAGKTLLLYLAIAEAQKKYPDEPCVLIDAERQFEFQAEWAEKVGVDISKLIVLKCSTAEECFDMIHALVLGEHEVDKKTGEVLKVINPGKYAIIGIDSVTQLVSTIDSVKQLGDSRQRGSQASAIGLGLKKVTSAMARTDVESRSILFFINQLRKNPNSLGRVSDYRTGGNALPFYDTVALKVAKVWDSVERDEAGEILSHDVKVTFEKNKAGPLPEDAIVFTLMHDGSGVNNEKELFDVAFINGVIKEYQTTKKDGKITLRYNFVNPVSGQKLYNDLDDFSKRKFDEILETKPEIKQKINDLIKDRKIFVNKDQVKEEIPDSAYSEKNVSNSDDETPEPQIESVVEKTELQDEESEVERKKRKKLSLKI